MKSHVITIFKYIYWENFFGEENDKTFHGPILKLSENCVLIDSNVYEILLDKSYKYNLLPYDYSIVLKNCVIAALLIV